jgi:hypothetical protein
MGESGTQRNVNPTPFGKGPGRWWQPFFQLRMIIPPSMALSLEVNTLNLKRRREVDHPFCK